MRRFTVPRFLHVWLVVVVALAGLASMVTAQPAKAATFSVPAGDVPALIAAINTANANGVADTIELVGGTYTFTQPISANVFGATGLPYITTEMTIIGNGATLMRSSADGTPDFRILAVFDGGDLTLDGVTISNGRAVLGAAIVINASVLRLTNSTVANNHSSLEGGGVNVNNGSTAFVTNSTISGNTASGAGGGIISFAHLIVTNSTITGNTAGGSGGGGVYISPESITSSLTNTIVAGNTTTTFAGDISGAVSGSHNLIGDGTGMSGLTNGVDGNQVGPSTAPIDPLLGDLASHDGSTPMMALLPGSPAIDAGTTTDETPTTDQRGTTRPQGTANDIGAYELVDATAPVITPTISGTLGTNGWYTGDVNVSWDVAEPESRVVSSDGCDPTTITTDSASQPLTCQATSVGGTASEPVTIKRDTTAPTVTYSGNLGTYGLSDTITIHCVATDATSGVASDDCADITGSATALGLGSHTVSATATDHAGNVATGSTSFVIGVTYADLCTLTQQAFRHPILARTACASLTVAQRADQANNVRVEQMVLNMYRLQIRMAMAFRMISVTDGQQLLDWSYEFD